MKEGVFGNKIHSNINFDQILIEIQGNFSGSMNANVSYSYAKWIDTEFSSIWNMDRDKDENISLSPLSTIAIYTSCSRIHKNE